MTERTSRFGWPHAFALLGVAGIVFMGVVIVRLMTVTERASTAVAEAGRAVVEDLTGIAKAFRTGTVTTTFLSYAAELNSGAYLQFATLDQTELFERRDEASVFWGRLNLPDVVVRATAPVQYTYYVDFDGPWSFRLDDHEIRVLAPAIQFNKPAIDASKIEYEVREDSLLRDEDEALELLKQGLTAMAQARAADNIELVREVGRRRIEEFVETWMFRQFGEDSRDYRVEVLFADEAPQLEADSPILLPAERETRQP